MTFSKIASILLDEIGYKMQISNSENEAKRNSIKINKNYPVYFSKSNTTGEKPFEEFYTMDEELELDRFYSLGVIKAKNNKSKLEIENFLKDLENIFLDESLDKNKFVSLLKAFLINFDHIETNISLDSKM